MDILYLSSVCSQSKFDDCASKGLITKLPQAQKYHVLLLEGLKKSCDGEVYVISSYPVIGKKYRYFSKESEKVNGIEFCYLGFLQLPFIRQLCLYVNAYREMKKFTKKYPKAVIICDILNHSIADAARLFGNVYSKDVCAIVTDVPGYTSNARIKTRSKSAQLFSKLAMWCSKGSENKYDKYLLLSEQMNDVVNLNKKEYVVIEGQCDIKMKSLDNDLENKANPKVMMYAGGIHKEFGIEMFVQAFLNLKNPDWELHIYGDGNYSKELRKISEEDAKIFYHGVVPNSLIIAKQLEASVLVNPRITSAEYVKYSFPSKTMECMASGTPLLTTKLPSMPKEYFEHVYFIDDETIRGMENAIKSVVKISDEDLHSYGDFAKRFIIEEKNNIVQAQKLIEFLK